MSSKSIGLHRTCNDGTTAVCLPFTRPNLAVQYDISGQMVTVYNCMEGADPLRTKQRGLLISIHKRCSTWSPRTNRQRIGGLTYLSMRITIHKRRSTWSPRTHRQRIGRLTYLLMRMSIDRLYKLDYDPPAAVVLFLCVASHCSRADGVDALLQCLQERWRIIASLHGWRSGTSLRA